MIHGGDIYRNQTTYDFSVNVNPLGIPEKVTQALYSAVECCSQYPDPLSMELKGGLSEMLGLPEEWILVGNGASELFSAIIHGLKPKKILIPVPSFYGYERAARAGGGEVLFYETKEEENFALTEDFLKVLTEELDLIFLANPGNPAGQLIPWELLEQILDRCLMKQIMVVLDECFLPFTDQQISAATKLKEYRNLLVVGAFTKTFAIPGVRLGFLSCAEKQILDQLMPILPEWNLSTFAQKAGVAAAGETKFLKQSREFIRTEKQFLIKELTGQGIHCFPTDANFILLKTEYDLYDKLLKRNILIRDCQNFRGLKKGYYRIAVRTREENEVLLKEIREITGA